MTPCLSILIATKDREKYLLDILVYILSWDRTDFEIIIQDNSLTNKLEEQIHPFLSDERVKYAHNRNWLSVSDNFNEGLLLASGEVVAMLGDDDGVLEETVDVAKWMSLSGVDAILPKHGFYTWPDLVSKYNSSLFNSNLLFSKTYSGKLNFVSVQDEVNLVMSKGCTTLGQLPRLYYGLIAKSVLDLIYERSNTYFPGPSPDMANAMATALVTKKIGILDFPLFVAGSCNVSGAGMGTKRMHEGKISSFNHLPKNCEEDWDDLIPKYWSGPTIWAESAFKAIRAMKKGEVISKFNMEYFFAFTLVFNYRQIKIILTKFNHNKLWPRLPAVTFYVAYIFWVRFKILLPKLLSKLNQNKLVTRLVISDKDCISEALIAYKETSNFKSIEKIFEDKNT